MNYRKWDLQCQVIINKKFHYTEEVVMINKRCPNNTMLSQTSLGEIEEIKKLNKIKPIVHLINEMQLSFKSQIFYSKERFCEMVSLYFCSCSQWTSELIVPPDRLHHLVQVDVRFCLPFQRTFCLPQRFFQLTLL